jgi:predicted pyridoxine 5'-phosphate oxidase superfamily flavin-nucleotide-binding protein
MISDEIKQYIDKSVLCWLATVDGEQMPNVSPKEVFTYYDNSTVIIANIASPQSAKNIAVNPLVCLSFIDILVQKGYQLKGTAIIVSRKSDEFGVLEKPLLDITQGRFPFTTIIKMTVTQSKKIVAPRYWLYPETTESDQMASAIKTYGF